MTLNDTSLTVAGNIIGNTVPCTGTISGTTRSAQGVYAGVATTYSVIEMVGTDGTYIDSLHQMPIIRDGYFMRMHQIHSIGE